jgi:hypothetical protein
MRRAAQANPAIPLAPTRSQTSAHPNAPERTRTRSRLCQHPVLHLCLAPHLTPPDLGPRWSAALTALGLMGSHFSPADKVECLAACCAQLSQLTDPCDGSFVRLVALVRVPQPPPV